MARCKLCGRPIEWVQHGKTGSWIPLDPVEVGILEGETGYLFIDGEERRARYPDVGKKVHMDTCPRGKTQSQLRWLRGEAD